MSTLPVSERTRVRRHPERGSHELELIHAILDEAYLCHVGFVHEGAPVVLPMAHVRAGDRIYLHGSSKNHMLGVLAGGAPACVEVTLLDGLVFARSHFSHSMNYRSVVLFGQARPITEREPKLAALAALCDRLAPGRSDESRAPSELELRATLVLELPISEASAKQRTGFSLDDEADLALPYWAGVVPLEQRFGAPIADPRLSHGLALAPSVQRSCAVDAHRVHESRTERTS
jgi:nitroimidazol reductase NimA-like FMN-containing flavoprotein (pyridoxamine 5'-phosphate oxidase superfamily)